MKLGRKHFLFVYLTQCLFQCEDEGWIVTLHIAGVGWGGDRPRSTKQIHPSHLPEWKDSCLDARSIRDLSAESTDKIADTCDNEDTYPLVSGLKTTNTLVWRWVFSWGSSELLNTNVCCPSLIPWQSLPKTKMEWDKRTKGRDSEVLIVEGVRVSRKYSKETHDKSW